MRLVKRWCLALPAILALAGSAAAAPDPGAAVTWPSGTAVVSYESDQALAAALDRHPAQLVRRIPALRVAALRPSGSVARFAQRIGAEPGITRVDRAASRRPLVEPGLASLNPAAPFQWQYAAVKADQVPATITQAASGFTIAVIDTGADLGAPDLKAKTPRTYSVRRRAGRCRGRQRARDVRGGARGRLVDERRRDRRHRRRCGADDRAGGRCRRRLHRRRRGRGDRLRGRPRRQDHQSQPGRLDDLLDREARG